MPESTNASLKDEFRSLKQWAESNKMIRYVLKTKEIVFCRHDTRLYIPPAHLNDVDRVDSVNLSRVYLSETLRFNEHLEYVLTICGHSGGSRIWS